MLYDEEGKLKILVAHRTYTKNLALTCDSDVDGPGGLGVNQEGGRPGGPRGESYLAPPSQLRAFEEGEPTVVVFHQEINVDVVH